MFKYKITNISGGQEDGGRAIFLTEAGVKINPGEVAYAHRLDAGTRSMPEILIDEGKFIKPDPPAKKKPAVVDDEDEKPVVKQRVEPGPGVLATVNQKEQPRKMVPLRAVGAEPEARPADDGESLSKDDLDNDVMSAKSGPSNSEEPAGFHTTANLSRG